MRASARNKEQMHEYYITHTEISLRQNEKKRQIKIRLLDYKGGKCAHCGIVATDDNQCIFDFHHLNPAEKERRVNNSVNWELSKEEADKCIMLCSNCHRLIHKKRR